MGNIGDWFSFKNSLEKTDWKWNAKLQSKSARLRIYASQLTTASRFFTNFLMNFCRKKIKRCDKIFGYSQII